MRIFALEDDIERIVKFRQKLQRHTVTYCDWVEDAKKLLKQDKYDVIFFDHDLGGEQRNLHPGIDSFKTKTTNCTLWAHMIKQYML